jgi:hypothetical protein
MLIENAIKAFEVWFFVDNIEIEAWHNWELQTRDIVNRCFNKQPHIDWIPTGALFPFAARRYLNECRYNMLWGK